MSALDRSDLITAAEEQPKATHIPSLDRMSSEYTLKDLSNSTSKDDLEAALPISSLAQDISPDSQDTDIKEDFSNSSPMPPCLQITLFGGLLGWVQRKRQGRKVAKVENYFRGPSPPEEIKPRSFKRETAFEKSLQRGLRRVVRPIWFLWAIFLAVWLVGVALLVNESWYSASTQIGE